MPVGRRPVIASMHFISQPTSAAISAYSRSKSPARRTGMRCRAPSVLLTGMGEANGHKAIQGNSTMPSNPATSIFRWIARCATAF